MNETTGYAIYPSLEGRPAFITGGGSGVGAALVRAFAGQGSRVAFVDIQDEPSACLADEVASEGDPRPLFIACDLRDIEALRRAIAEAAEAHGPVTVLVNNAAHDQRHRFEEVTVAY